MDSYLTPICKEEHMELGSLVLTICAALMAVVIGLGLFASKVYK